MRVFLDTNVLVSAFATRGLCADVLRQVLLEHDLVVSELVIEELRRALRNKLRVSPAVIDEAEALLREHEVVPTPEQPLELPVRELADRLIVTAAAAAGAHVLVTGDRDLLDFARATPLPIVDPRGFWNLVRQRQGRPEGR